MNNISQRNISLNFDFILLSNRIWVNKNLILAKRLSEKEKKNLVEFFKNGKTIDELTKKFNCTKSTITRNLIRIIGEEKYKDLMNQSKKETESISIKEKKIKSNLNKNKLENNVNDEYLSIEKSSEELFPMSPFVELTPFNCEIENTSQKDLSSIPIAEIDFPNIVYMIVDKKIELETKYLREYPEWQFLSEKELNRKTIEIYFDLKIAKRFCKSEQKVIKVPNTDVFKIAAPILLQKGISRIVSADQLISL